MPPKLSGGRPSRLRLTLLFLVVTLPPAVTLLGLGTRLIQQDRALEAQRESESREATADALVRELSQFVTETERWSENEIPENAVGFTITSEGLRAYPQGRLLWGPVSQPLKEAASGPFEDIEFAKEHRDPEAALALYGSYNSSADAGIRAGALQRVARVNRQLGRMDAAIEAYRSLALLHGISVNGMPADLVARRAVCDILLQMEREKEFRQQVELLEADFLAGRWRLQRSHWELVERNLQEWTGRPLLITPDRRALSAAIDWVHEKGRREGAASIHSEGLVLDDGPVTLLFRGQRGIVLGHSIIQQWVTTKRDSHDAVGLSLLSAEGEWAAGEKTDSMPARASIRNGRDTGLPWTIVLTPKEISVASAEFAGRRRLLTWGLAAIIVLLAGGVYFLWRVIQRELAVARLQTDFVAAVSHEFRTPLTSLRHVTELLEEDDGMPQGPERERRKAFYSALGRNTQRLHRLVESLLDFSRMETGRRPWNLLVEDVGSLVSNVVGEFQKELETRGVPIELNLGQSDSLHMRADAEALGHALWNLLDNAVKYSPDGRAIHVSVTPHPKGIAIAVRDQGLGIPSAEHREIFRKFVRGQKANELGIKGTGIGLAMVSYIVEAHGGTIELESEESKGSTFRLVLPRCEQPERETAPAPVRARLAPDS